METDAKQKEYNTRDLTGLALVVREEQLSIQRRLSEALLRIKKLEDQLAAVIKHTQPGGE